MTISTVSTYGSLQTLLQNMNTSQNTINNDQIQISSGQQSQTFDGLQGSIEQFTSMNAQITRLTAFQQSNTNTIGQMQTTNTVVGQIVTLATNVKNLIASQMNGTSSNASFQQQLQSESSSLASLLNSTYGQSFIFAGTNTSTPPVITPVPDPAQEGVPDTKYYQGSHQDQTTRISDSQIISPNIRADNPAFQQLFAGISQALKATSGTTTDSTALKNSENLVDSGLNGAIAIQATVNANIVIVQQVNTQSQTLQTYFKGLVSNMSSSDVVALSAKVAQDTNTLQASYSTFARISQLSLVNYLK